MLKFVSLKNEIDHKLALEQADYEQKLSSGRSTKNYLNISAPSNPIPATIVWNAAEASNDFAKPNNEYFQSVYAPSSHFEEPFGLDPFNNMSDFDTGKEVC